MAKTTNDRIAAIDLEIEQLGNQRKELLQKKKEADRRARTSRLCRRSGLLESILPDTILLTDERFKTLLEMTIASNEGNALLAELKAEQDKQNTDTQSNPKTQDNPAPTAKPAVTEQNVSLMSAANGENKQTQAIQRA
jgi:hypothetical protein